MSKESVEDLEAALRYVKDEDLLSVLLEMLVERPVSSGHTAKRDVLLEAIHAARQLKENSFRTSGANEPIWVVPQDTYNPNIQPLPHYYVETTCDTGTAVDTP